MLIFLLVILDFIVVPLLFIFFGKRDPSILQSIIKITKSSYVMLLIYLGSFAIVFSFIAIITYNFYKYIPDPEDKEGDFNRWEKSLTLAASTASFLALAVSIKIWQDTDKRQINLATLSLFEKFRDDRFHDIRHRAWKVKNKWDNQKGYKEKFEKAAFPEDMLSKNNKISEEVKVVRDLFEFFAVLGGYNGSEDALKICSFFYYGWWRKFLYEIAELHDLYYIPLKSLESSDNKSYNNYKEAISYVGKLERLDYLCDLDKFDHKDDFHNYG